MTSQIQVKLNSIARYLESAIVESGWNVWVRLMGVARRRRRVWLVRVGGIYECG